MNNILGILLAGGNGTRLRPLTEFVNKHLLPIGRLPMIEYPLMKLINAGIKNIHVVTGGENYPAVVKYLGSGSKWQVNITYSIQDKAGGIAEALGLAEGITNGRKMVVILGDNLFEMDLREPVYQFNNSAKEKEAILFSCFSINKCLVFVKIPPPLIKLSQTFLFFVIL